MQEVFEKIIDQLRRFIEGAKSEGDWSYVKPFENAIEIVKQAATEYEQDREYRYMAQLADAILKHGSDIAEKYEKAVTETSNTHINGWIPVEERLPEESLNSVLCWDEYRKSCCFAEYWGGRWILGNDIDSVNITAWQPLPEPYQPKGE